MKILVISPHPDDMELACGATVHRLTTEGHEVVLAVVTGQGDLTMLHSQETISFQQRVDEQIVAAKRLGVTDIRWLGFAPASKFDTQPMSKLVSALDALLPDFDLVFIPLPSYNVDHDITFKACMAATRPTKCDHLQVLAYEQTTQYHGVQVGNQLQNTVYYKVSKKDLTAKLLSISEHQSQMNGRTDSIGSVGGVDALAKLRGMECQALYAERFTMIREVR